MKVIDIILGLIGAILIFMGIGVWHLTFEGTPRLVKMENPYAGYIQAELDKLEAEEAARALKKRARVQRLKELYGDQWEDHDYWWHDD